MPFDLPRFVSTLATTKDWNSHYQQVDDLSRRGEVDVLVALATELEESGKRASLEKLRLESVVDRIELALALGNSLEHLETLCVLLERPRITTVQRSRTQLARQRPFASVLASEQSRARLLEFLDRRLDHPPLAELCACLAHELVLRGASAGEHGPIDRAWVKMNESGHPLAELPSWRTPMEGQLSFPSYGLSGSSWGMPFGPVEAKEPAPLRGGRLDRSACREVVDPARAELIGQSVADWLENSNGRCEARTWEIQTLSEGPIDLAVDDLRALGLDCLAGTQAQDISIHAASPEECFAVLFAAASTGGAYTHGLGGAWGRLAAWQSIAGLLGKKELQPFDELSAAASKARWFEFQAKSSWFYQIAWDIGLIVLEPDSRSLAVLAVTDQD